uniref:40S ribosomal protein S30 n=1 Tax=Steinernema glaseri TaxID=37863 RepID=A0A1I7Z6C2_9BILA
RKDRSGTTYSRGPGSFRIHLSVGFRRDRNKRLPSKDARRRIASCKVVPKQLRTNA